MTLILDGGLSTPLLRNGRDLKHPLWVSRFLQEKPALIEAVHREYFDAGAELAITASYQASHAGYEKLGVSVAEADRLMLLSVTLADRARAGRPFKIAASMGNYGAHLANRSEYTGAYGKTAAELVRFHERKFILFEADPRADYVLFETIPSLEELRAIRQLVHGSKKPVWVSLCLKDGHHLADGTALREVVTFLRGAAVIGINCTSLAHTDQAIKSGLFQTMGQTLAVYPNVQNESLQAWGDAFDPWIAQGVEWIGGCCGSGPEHVKLLAEKKAAYG